MSTTTSEIRPPSKPPSERDPLPALFAEALNQAHVEGLSLVASGEMGVRCVSTHGGRRWEADPNAEGVSPLGAVVLLRQPPAVTPDQAAAIACNTSMRWVEAFAVGVSGLAPITMWRDHVAYRLMAAAWLFGVQIRTTLALAQRRAARVR